MPGSGGITAAVFPSWSFTAGGNIRPGRDFSVPGDHLQRYLWVGQFVRGCDVVDAGCGYGYGSSYLARHGARSVLGVDVDSSAVSFAKRTFGAPNCSFRRLDLTKDVTASESFDAAVCFEVLEHVKEPRVFLQNLRRLLRPGGSLFLSTPNKKYTERFYVSGRSPNPYHIHEYYPEELMELLSEFFELQGFYFQFSDFDLDPERIRIAREYFEYAEGCPIPSTLRRLFPKSFKDFWLRSRGITAPREVAVKWSDYRVEPALVDSPEGPERPVQIFHVVRSSDLRVSS
jgi:SAM-dependent methyltransferase